MKDFTIQCTPSACDAQLSIGQILTYGVAKAPTQEIVYGAERRYTYATLAERVRRLASALAVFFGAVLFYLLVWTPVEGGLARARSRLVSVQAQLARVQEQAARAASMRAAPRVTLPANPAAAVGQAAERQGLRERLKRTDAEGANAVRVQIEDAPFAALMAWLAELQQQSGLRAESATLDRGANPGTVNGRLLLRAQGS